MADMVAGIHHPRPQRPTKRAFADCTEDITLELPPCAPSVTNTPLWKRRRLQTPILEGSSKLPRPATAPLSPRAAAVRHPDPLSVEAWIATTSFPPKSSPISLARPPTCPASIDVKKGQCHPITLNILSEMSSTDDPSSATTQSSRHRITDAQYRSTLNNNGVYFDLSGRSFPKDIRCFIDSDIYRRRSSPPLTCDAIKNVFDVAEDIADNTEAAVKSLTQTAMFPLNRPSVAAGGDSPWDTTALPRNPEAPFQILAPRPDIHLGYAVGQKGDWTAQQRFVLDHRVARPYTQPTRSNAFPFLVFEIKAEATGGTLHVAENQAAGSGSHAVSALRWLLEEAPTGARSGSCLDTIAFSIGMSHRLAVLYVHWYSEDDRHYYMSKLRSFDSFSAADVQACNSTVKNIIDYGLGVRKSVLGAALEALFPFPEHWAPKRAASQRPITPSSSYSEGSKKRKTQGRCSSRLEAVQGL